MVPQPTVRYDANEDVIEITFFDPEDVEFDEFDGVWVFADQHTGRVSGITIDNARSLIEGAT
jgi:hypothetical protein